MPEEINRVMTDSIADYLFVTEQSGVDNLRAEGISKDKIFLVGNLMIDSLVRFREKASRSGVLDELQLERESYVLMTMHRPSNVDHAEGINRLLKTIAGMAERRPVVFPMHPRTRNRIIEFDREADLAAIDNLHVLEPLGYLEFLHLMEHAAAVVTDSGGIQEETTFLGVPCLTLRENTERPITITMGTNELMDLDPDRVVARVEEVTDASYTAQRPPYWDGTSANRILQVLERYFVSAPAEAAV